MTFTYKGRPVSVAQVGRELGVRYVVEGSVRKIDNRVRITAQLIDAATGTHVWADRYDRDLTDVFAVQDEVTREIVGALRLRLTPGGEASGAAEFPAGKPAAIADVFGQKPKANSRLPESLAGRCAPSFFHRPRME